MSRENRADATPERILQTGMGFQHAKLLFSAVKLELFSELGSGALSAAEIQRRLELHERSLHDFLDALVALGFLHREGFGDDARYRNAPDTDRFLDRNKPEYLGGLLEMANDRLYPFWGTLEEALQTGRPQNEIKHEGVDLFDKLYADPARLEQFMAAMAGIQMEAFRALAESFDFSQYETLCDIGGASGTLAIEVARAQPHMRCITADLPLVQPIARRTIQRAGLEDRVEARHLDFWEEAFPACDVITMGNILHDWNHEEKRTLLAKAADALTGAGALIVVENIIDDERREAAFGLLMSLNMLIETPGGFNFSGADFDGWAREAGFRRTEVLPLAGPSSAAIAYK